MKRAARSLAATALVSLLGAAVMWWSTDGFSAFTTESGRRAQVLRAPRQLPATVLEDQDGRLFSLRDYRGRLVAVEFIYTRCPTVCRSLGIAFRQVRDSVPPAALGRDVVLLSISFDPERDAPAALKGYGQAHGADGAHWRIARVRSMAELEPLLDAFGIVVIPDGLGGFEHNAAIHLIGRDGKLARISDLGEAAAFAASIAKLL